MIENRLQEIRKKRGLSAGELAEKTGSTQPTIHRLETGKVSLTLEWMEILAEALDCQPSDLIKSERKVQILGYVGAGFEIYPVDDHAHGAGLDDVEAPPGAGPRTVAVIVRGDSMYPAYRDNDLIFYEEINGDTTNLIGKECVVKLASGATYIKFVQQGTTPDTYTLNSYNAPPMVDQIVEWAALVRWVERR